MHNADLCTGYCTNVQSLFLSCEDKQKCFFVKKIGGILQFHFNITSSLMLKQIRVSLRIILKGIVSRDFRGWHIEGRA